MKIRIDPHARQRMQDRGLTEDEVRFVLENGSSESARLGRLAKSAVFDFGASWAGKTYPHKKVKIVYAEEIGETVVVTVYVFYGTFK